MLRDQGYKFKSDIFALGCVFFNLISGYYLFNGENIQEKLEKNKICDLSIINQYLSHVSSECKSLLYKMLCDDPEQRPSAKEAL